VGYEGYKKSLYAQDWFDSSTERDLANILDDEPAITLWVRLQIGDLPILWTDGGREYNPDFIAIDTDSTHWVVEVKMNKEMSTPEVKGKRDAARRWANYVSADEKVGGTRWRYLLLSENDVKTAKGSWEALKKLGGES
jgi:type III restriction enzyme